MLHHRATALASTVLLTALIQGCGGTPAPDDAASTDVAAHDVVVAYDAPPDAAVLDVAAPDASDASDASPAPDVVDDTAPPGDGGALMDVTFSYHPQWAGVTAVTVLGSFGQAHDWTAPFATLTDDGHGTFTGHAMLPAGSYSYVFHVTGDTAAPAAMVATYARYSIDPDAPDVVACPMASPTYSTEMNPCSVLHVPQPAAATPYHVRGTAQYDGHPVAGWLAMIERDDTGTHHFFANRSTTGTDGTFDLTVAPGTYRVQLLHPTYLSETDAMRNPAALAGARRVFSASMHITADADFGSVETAYHDYARLTPTPSAPLPVTFNWSLVAGAQASKLAIYGPGMNIGDPWYTTMNGAATTASFTGTFNTMQARETTATTTERYWWGTWQTLSHAPSAVVWTQESMVVPITFM